MTGIDFHFNMPDKLPYALRLLRKAVSAGAWVTVTGEPELLKQVDAALWTLAAHEFVPHCRAGAEPHLLAHTPLLLTTDPARQSRAEVLVNLGSGVPAGFERFARVIEMVSQDPEDRQAGRSRWKHYADRGYAIVRHDIAVKGSP